jgi:hypothetical protein
MKSRVQNGQYHQVRKREKQIFGLLPGRFGRAAQKSQVTAPRELAQIVQTDPRQ